MTGENEFGIDGLSDFTEIGFGGFAVTYAAYEADQDRTVAVKILRDADEDARRRFDRERRTMGNTTGHANIVTLFRSGFTPIGGQPFLVMEYLAAGSLEDLLARAGPLPVADAVNLILPVAEALGFSHAMGVVHKDVKPANILVSDTGAVKLTDFGIAALRDSSTISQLAYSPAYAPPESFDARRDPATGMIVDLRDERSDLYSLAASLFTMVTGAPPFDGSQLSLMRQIADVPVPPTGHPGLDRFLAVAMAKHPDHRHRDAASFVAALRTVPNASSPAAFHRSAGDAAPPMATPSAPTPPTPWSGGTADGGAGPADDGGTGASHDGSATAVAGPSERRSGPAPLVLGLLAAVVGLGVVGGLLGVLALQGGGDQAVDATPEAVESVDDGTDQVDAPTATDDGSPQDQPPDDDRPTITEENGATVLTLAADDLLTDDGVAVVRNGEGILDGIVAMDDGRIALGGDRLEVWNPAVDGVALTTLSTPPVGDPVTGPIRLFDGTIAYGVGSTLQVWDPDAPARPMQSQDIGFGILGRITALLELPDGRILVSVIDQPGGSPIVMVADWIATPAITELYTGHAAGGRAIVAMALLPDGRVATASGAEIHVWDPAAPSAEAVIYRGHDTSEALASVTDTDVVITVTAVEALPDGTVVSAGRDGFENRVHFWDQDDPSAPTATVVVDEPVDDLLVLADGRVAGTRSDDLVVIWYPDTPGYERFAEFRTTDSPLSMLTQLPDGRLAAGDRDGRIHLWDPACPTDERSEPGGFACYDTLDS
ncbi:MAG: serine/threonine-protein kinase [Actinomycetota bacterium]